jgi:hypothetical protein
VGIVDGRVHGDGSCRASIVVGVFENELLELGSLPLALVEDAMVMDGASCTLDSDMRAQVEVEFKGVRAAGLDESSRKRVTVAVALASVRKEADVVALSSDDDSELGDGAAKLAEELLHVVDFFFQNGQILAFTNPVTNIKYALRSSALAETLHPVLGHGTEVILDVGSGDHFDTVAVGLNIRPVLGEEGIGRDGDGGK